MDFSFTEEQILLRDSVRKLMDRVATPEYVARVDREKAYPHELFAAWTEAGLFGLPFPEDLGGAGGSVLDLALVSEEIGRTSADLVMNGVTIPAGKYTLFTHTGRAGYQLIVNKQVGQWGTEYRPDQDLTRVPAQASATPETVERFTISVEPQGSNGVLRLAWGKQQLTVPFAVK